MSISFVDDPQQSVVSILVFVELALDVVYFIAIIPICRVSILVFVELALDVRPSVTSPVSGSVVSILVFVELALDDTILSLTTIMTMSFNPCFRGTCS